jgi:hypothetical protein
MEQTCPDCGRWEAAGAYCTFCYRPMTKADYYRNGDKKERLARAPQKPPVIPTTPLHRGRRPKVKQCIENQVGAA